MTSKEEHIRKIKEHLASIEDAINEGIENKPITIGFHCSACSIEMLELYLHSANKISIGHIIKHDWCQEPPVKDWWHDNATLRVVLEHAQNSTSDSNHLSQTSGILTFKKPKLEQKIEPLIERKLKINFDRKQEIYELIYNIEGKRDNLVYGSPAKKTVEDVLNNFLKLKVILINLLNKNGIKIE